MSSDEYQLVSPGLAGQAGDGDNVAALRVQHVGQEGLQHIVNDDDEHEHVLQEGLNLQHDDGHVRDELELKTLIVQKCASTFTSKLLTILSMLENGGMIK